MSERKVMISVDGSGPSNRAFDWYLSDMRRDGDFVIVVHVAEYNINVGLPGIQEVDIEAITQQAKSEDDRIQLMLNSYMEKLRTNQIKGQAKLLRPEGKAGEVIVKCATEDKVSAIIMGSRGLSKLRRTLLGSVSEYVIHHAPPNCAVSICRDSS